MRINRLKTFVSLAILAAFMTLWFCLCYWQMLKGDDLRMFFDKGLNVYLDKSNQILGERITTMGQVFQVIKEYYLFWTGRMVGVATGTFLAMFDPIIVNVLTAISLMLVVLFSAGLSYGSVRQGLLQPTALAVLSAMLFWYNRGMFYMVMRTFTTQYGLTMVLYTGYLLLTYQLAAKGGFPGWPDARSHWYDGPGPDFYPGHQGYFR
jgi:hypothetical protein